MLVLVLLGVTFVTLSDENSQGGVFGKARSYARYVANPFQSAVHSVLEPVGNFLYGATHYNQLQQQNDDLRAELAAAGAQQVAAAAAQQEAEQVLGEQHLSFIGNLPSVAAQVVDLGSANFEQSIEVNRGSDSGVAVGQPVVTAGGLVGRVTSVSADLATITLIDDPLSVVGVRVVRSGVVGAAAGNGLGNPLQVNDINIGSAVRRGDKLVTSGLQLEDYPPGIPVGTVTKVVAPSGALQLTVTVNPLANLVNLELVRVVLWSPQTG